MAFRSLAKGGMVVWDFSTALEMMMASPDNQADGIGLSFEL